MEFPPVVYTTLAELEALCDLENLARARVISMLFPIAVYFHTANVN